MKRAWIIYFQISWKILELVLLSVGLISTLVLMKESVLPYSCKLVFSSLIGFWSSIICFLSSPSIIIIMINLMVLIILASSTFYTREPPDNHHHGITTLLDVHDHDHHLQTADHDHDHASPVVSPSYQKSMKALIPEVHEIDKGTSSSQPTQVKTETKALPPPHLEKWKNVIIENDEEEDTMDATWQAIIGGGQQKAKEKPLKKGGTRNVPLPPLSRDIVEVNPPPSAPPQVETTSSRNNTTSTVALAQGMMRYHDVLPQNPLFFNEALIPKVHEFDRATSSLQSTQVNTETKALPPPPPLEKWKYVFIENDEEEGTMEATWKAITDGGQQKPKKKPLKKSGTWNVPPPPPPPPPRYVAVQRLDSEEVMPTSHKWKELRKAETFNDSVSLIRRGGLIRRDSSMSLEEFNQKVEAFIKKSKSKDNMRLQRKESHQRFLDVINQKVFN